MLPVACLDVVFAAATSIQQNILTKREKRNSSEILYVHTLNVVAVSCRARDVSETTTLLVFIRPVQSKN